MRQPFISLALSLFTILPALALEEACEPASSVGSTAGSKSIGQPTEKAETAPSVHWIDQSQKPRLLLLCIHGLGLHKGTYEAFGKEMSKYGIAVYAIDMRGFGDWLGSGKNTGVDFDGSMADVRATLEQLHQRYPGLPIVILGESMGGAIALRAAALFPDLVSGLVSCVPSGDRFNELGQDLKVGMHVLFGGGFNSPLNIGSTMVKQATKKEALRDTWQNDPSGKMELTPSELLKFRKFMGDNFDAAKHITSLPVLFIQGVSDKLVKPAGTWQLYDSLPTPNRQFVLSKNGEHLIFEEAQFSKEDLLFVRTWLSKNIAPLDQNAIASQLKEPAVASTHQQSDESQQAIASANRQDEANPSANTSDNQHNEQSKPATTSPLLDKTVVAVTPPNTRTPSGAVEETGTGLNYWIELYRNGKTYRCNNKTEFKSGDSIRFHMIPERDGFAYVLMKESSSGKSAILFPTEQTGTSNYLSKGQDYPLPYKTWLQFDQNPGTERLSLVFSQTQLHPDPLSTQRYVTAYVSPERSGAKDLVPTRMQLSWDDPTPVIMPDSFNGNSQLAQKPQPNGSLVRLRANSAASVLAIDIALAHN